jgi:hypothetical protein
MSWWGTEYWPYSKATIGVLLGTTLVVPNATVNGLAATGCSHPAHLDRGPS